MERFLVSETQKNPFPSKGTHMYICKYIQTWFEKMKQRNKEH